MVEQLVRFPHLPGLCHAVSSATGALSLPRRLELLTWAQQTRALILEDDYDSEYRYGDRPIPALQGLDQNHSVLYLGTFPRCCFPPRIGYLYYPNLVALFAQAVVE